MQRTPAYEQTPSLSVPLRFFLSAPFFLLIAAVLLLWEGPAALLSRWSPTTLALTHLLTLGFLSMTMIGALLQILPVVTNVQLPYPQWIATIVHSLLTLGTLLLAWAFWRSYAPLFRLALLCLVPAFLWLLISCTFGLSQKMQAKSKSAATLTAIRLAVIALAFTVLLGVAMASTFAWQHSLPLQLLTDLHVLWGLPGWVGILIIGVAFQVVPMFQVTSLYPADITRWLVAALFMLLIMWSTETILEAQRNTITLSGILLAGFSLFAAVTVYLLALRKRPKADAVTLFWCTAMASLFLCAVVWLIQLANPHAVYPMTLGVLFIIGFAGSLINGMLYKIVPFLLWYHAQSSAGSQARKLPNIKQLLPEQAAVRQFRSYLLALLLLISATLFPETLTRPAALAMCISSGWLLLNLLNAVRIHTNANRDAVSLVGA